MSKVRTFLLLGLLVGSMVMVAGCCGFDPCDPFPDPCGCDDPCATPAAAPAAPADAAPAGKSCGGGSGCGGGKSCG